MNNYIRGGALIIVLLVVLGFIGYRVLGVPSSQSAAAGSARQVPIGFIAPLTGPFADWGESIRRGMQLATEDTHHSFAVDYQDDACDATKGLTIGTSMMTFQNIRLIVGPGCSDTLHALTSLADQHHALMFSTGLLDDAAFGGHSSVMNFATQISTEAKFMASYLHQEGRNNIAFVHGTNVFGTEFARAFPPAVKARGMNLELEDATDIDETDFRTVALKIRSANPDAVFIHQGEKQIGILVRQLRQLGYSGPLYAYYGAESQSTVAAGGKAIEGLKYTYPVGIKDGDELVTEFNKRYAKAFGAEAKPTATTLFVYDGMQILDKALDQCSDDDTACVRKYFVGLGEYHGLSGTMQFNSDGSITRPFGIKEIRDGKFEWVTTDLTL
jgi:branched-chain amino acid transport system substrate-binding protein